MWPYLCRNNKLRKERPFVFVFSVPIEGQLACSMGPAHRHMTGPISACKLLALDCSKENKHKGSLLPEIMALAKVWPQTLVFVARKYTQPEPSMCKELNQVGHMGLKHYRC